MNTSLISLAILLELSMRLADFGFRKIFSKKFDEAQRRGDLRTGVDAAPVFTAAYMQFFNYFLVEKLFGGNQHLGLSDDQALNCLTKVFAYGTLSEEKLASFKKRPLKSVV